MEHFCDMQLCTVGHKSNDPCFHVILMEAGVMTFDAHCTSLRVSSNLSLLIRYRGVKILHWV